MKWGVLVYKKNKANNIFNIGDYIQSLAAMQFLETDNPFFLNREELDLYMGDDIKLIMNGWFLHSPKNWPPSPKIRPLFVAFHLNKLAKDEILNKEDNIRYFREHQPIGCRDRYTMQLLKEKGVNAYFSGCLTLTLGLTNKNEVCDNRIYFVDAPVLPSITFRSIIRSCYLLLSNNRAIKTIYYKRNLKRNFLNYIKNILFIEKYSRIFTIRVLESADYLEHEIEDIFNDDNKKFRYAQDLLNKYSKAKFVVTSRIHCALPCLAMETPVLFVFNNEQDEISKCRMDGLIQLFNTIEVDRKNIKSSLFARRIDIDTCFENKSLYKKYRDDLIARCEVFCKANDTELKKDFKEMQ